MDFPTSVVFTLLPVPLFSFRFCDLLGQLLFYLRSFIELFFETIYFLLQHFNLAFSLNIGELGKLNILFACFELFFLLSDGNL